MNEEKKKRTGVQAGRPLKYNEKTRMLTVRVPESRYNEIKKKIADMLDVRKQGEKYISEVLDIVRTIVNAKIWKFKKLGIEFREKENIKYLSIKQILEIRKKVEKFLLKQRDLHTDHSIFEKLSSVVNYYAFRLRNIEFGKKETINRKLDTCPFCFGGKEEKRIDFDKMSRNIEKTKRYYEKAKENRVKYQKHVNFITTSLDKLQKGIKYIKMYDKIRSKPDYMAEFLLKRQV